ncbi:MAG: hypothetical protein ACR2MO_13570 [Acidimicrobiales bacterium]
MLIMYFHVVGWNQGNEMVGVDPRGAGDLAARLDEVEAQLGAQALRVQGLLDAAGVTSTVPLTIRSAGRTCGGTAEDLRRRTRVLMSPAGGGASSPGAFSAPGWQGALRGLGATGAVGAPCTPSPPPAPSRLGTTSWITSITSLRPGPWVTPLPSLRTGPWVTSGGLVGPQAGPKQNTTTVPGASCGHTVYSTGADPIRDLVAANLASTSKRYTEDELETGSETLTEEQKQAVRDKQAGRPFVKGDYDSARSKLTKSEKVAGTRNAGKQRGGPRK